MSNDNEFIWAHNVKGDLHNAIDVLDDCTRNGFTSFNLITVEKYLDKVNKGLVEIKKCLGMVKKDEPKETKRKASKARTGKTRRNHRRR